MVSRATLPLILLTPVVACDSGDPVADRPTERTIQFDPLPVTPDTLMLPCRLWHRWKDAEVRWHLEQPTTDLSLAEQAAAIQSAFDMWVDVTTLSFLQVQTRE